MIIRHLPVVVRQLACICVTAFLAACASTDVAPPVVKEAVAEAPCDRSKMPVRPVLPGDSLSGDEDIFVIGTTLWADRLARRAYEAPLERFADECSRK